MKLFVVGVSHKTAPIELREQLSVQRSELVDVAHYLKWFGHLDEIVLLSTCNRVEIYGTTERRTNDLKSLFQFLSSEEQDLREHIYIHEDIDAARHLFRVTAGLDSMMLGETEITGQIKNAYGIAHAAGLTGPVLNRLFQKAFQATKEIRTRTGIGRGAVSIKSVAVELMEKIFAGELAHKSIMIIGAGEMAERCVRLLVKKGVRSILLSNRSFDRAVDLAMQCGGRAVCFGDCLFAMPDVDLVITVTSSAETLLNRGDIENLMKTRHYRPLNFIDLSVPRNIDPAIANLDNVSLYNIDDLESIAREGMRSRARELAACHQIIESHVTALVERLYDKTWRLSTAARAALLGNGGRAVRYDLETGPSLLAVAS
jgi:glutamyl-tRNA reductase